jgi:hypothetical protein|tara:strand:+ start:5419 stop:6312 length:894 start_codon:yes stop_codon:yes gene_type:complete
MSVVYTQGELLGRGDLDIFLSNSVGNPVNAFAISYALYYVDPTSGTEVLIGDAARTPVNPSVGEYYASLQIPSNAAPGDYRIRWLFRETSISPEEGAVQEFGVVSDAVTTSSTYTACVADLIRKMRFMTRDNDPDRNYRFMPPEGEGTIGCYNQVFGYIWTDEEFAEYLEISLWKWNMMPPETEELNTLDKLCIQKAVWKAPILWGALVNAAQALAYNWVANEFDYSIGGISLSIEKSSKYESLKENAESQWDKLTEAKVRTTKYLRGLAQPRFGRGVRSAFGPYVGRGVLSPRNFV